MTWEVIQGDAIETMRGLPPASVDACITDPPYGTTACAWDSVIPFAPMWVEVKRIVKPKGAIVLFGSQPFTSALVMSNPTMFKYELIWDKKHTADFLLSQVRPMKYHENLCVFAQESATYNPEKWHGKPNRGRNVGTPRYRPLLGTVIVDAPSDRSGMKYPRSILEFQKHVASQPHHENEKPLDLMRYLVRMVTHEGDTVLDFTCGSGTTGVACEIEGRNSVNIDSDAHYCDVARARITRASGVAADIPRRVKEFPPTPLFDTVSIQGEMISE